MFVLALILAAPVFRGGSVLGVVVVPFAIIVAVGAAAGMRHISETSEGKPSAEPTPAVAAWGHEHPLLRVAAGTVGGLVGLLAGLFGWWAAFAAFTGCSFHCDVDDRSPLVGLALSALTVGALGAAAWSVAWGAGGSVRVRRIAAATVGALGALAVATTAIGSFVDA